MRDDVDYGARLYPFLYGGGDGEPSGADRTGLATVLEEVRRSVLAKAGTIVELRGRLHAEHAAELGRCAVEMAQRFRAGGTLLAFGNGGSATDASDVVADCLEPPLPHWPPLPALDLTRDGAIVTAIGNDVGFDNVFSRQVIAYGRPGDVALGFSTSGSSRNVLNGLRRAHDDGLLTVAFAGYDGGEMSSAPYVDHCIVVHSDHIPRIQEGHATAWHALLAATHEALS